MAKAWRKIGGKNKHIRRLGIMADQAFRVNPGVSARMAWLRSTGVVPAWLRSTGVVPAHDFFDKEMRVES